MADLLERPKEDKELAMDLMNDLLAVLVKHECAIVHKDMENMTVLVKYDLAKRTLRPLVILDELSPLVLRFKLFSDGKARTTLQ